MFNEFTTVVPRARISPALAKCARGARVRRYHARVRCTYLRGCARASDIFVSDIGRGSVKTLTIEREQRTPSARRVGVIIVENRYCFYRVNHRGKSGPRSNRTPAAVESRPCASYTILRRFSFCRSRIRSEILYIYMYIFNSIKKRNRIVSFVFFPAPRRDVLRALVVRTVVRR